MLLLGPVIFSTNGTSFDSIRRAWEFNWRANELAGRYTQLQYTGEGRHSLEIDGVVYPGRYGSEQVVDLIAGIARAGFPLPIIGGGGQVLGSWVIDSVNKTGTVYNSIGSARKIEFTVGLSYYGITPHAETNRRLYDKLGAIPDAALDMFT